jgi:hypothetical protein
MGPNRGRVAVIGDGRLGGRGMMDQSHSWPGTLAEFLKQPLPLFREPPDADWVYGLVQIYETSPEIVWRAVRWLMPAAPPTPSPAGVDASGRRGGPTITPPDTRGGSSEGLRRGAGRVARCRTSTEATP